MKGEKRVHIHSLSWFWFPVLFCGIQPFVSCCNFPLHVFVFFPDLWLCTPVFHLFIAPCVFKSVFMRCNNNAGTWWTKENKWPDQNMHICEIYFLANMMRFPLLFLDWSQKNDFQTWEVGTSERHVNAALVFLPRSLSVRMFCSYVCSCFCFFVCLIFLQSYLCPPSFLLFASFIFVFHFSFLEYAPACFCHFCCLLSIFFGFLLI